MMDKKNYITVHGYNQLQDELHNLVTKERPVLVQTITWAASNGDRSENADYIYGKRRLREVDKRIRMLTQKIQSAEVVHHILNKGNSKVFFGAEVTILRNTITDVAVRIVGQDEIDPKKNYISWTSPLAKNLLGKVIGDIFKFNTPNGVDEIEVLDVNYN
ncbi:MAG: transcription elongation factor GreB [Proteobacteria bacterium]|nr:transcription elongation factor GreB [Pseudomonadota bacterium]